MPPDQARLNELLHWAVENTPQPAAPSTAVAPTSSDSAPLSIAYSPVNPTVEPPEKKKLDTAVLDAILGRSDALWMREAMDVFEDPKKSTQERCNAAEQIEDLVQDLDNANDMEVLGFWPRLTKLLEIGGGAADDEELIKFHACWICGTAVQNNPKSQVSFLKQDPLPVILEILSNATEATQAKALYCLSSTLKHAPASTNALGSFTAAHGWDTLHSCLRGPSMTLRRKTAFLINTLVLEDSLQLQLLRSSGLLSTLIVSLSPTKGIPSGINGDLGAQDEDYTEKALRAISTILIQSVSKPDQQLSDSEKQLIKEVFAELGTDSGSFKLVLEASGIGETEWALVLEVLGFSR